jgi:hypothetical protein
VGIEVSTQGNRHHANVFFLPGDVTGDGVYADVQDLGIERGELLAGGVERRHLGCSSRGPVKRVEADHDVLLALVVGEPYAQLAFPGHRGKVEVGGWITGLQGHKWLV